MLDFSLTVIRKIILKQYCALEKTCNFVFSTKTPSKYMTSRENSNLDQNHV